MNRLTITGYVGRDPEIRETKSGGKVANFSVATTDKWKDKKTGERKEKTEWHRCVCFSDGLIGVIERYVRKGSHVLVEGQVQTRKWTDKDQQERYTTEVVMSGYVSTLELLSSKAEDSAATPSTPSAPDFDDAIPF
ncbi:MAG: single-stranded DNA-binding protein [Halobacteriovorax sp.]|nr:single-stranded DNA-binding protein [Halobacteriovorax sp.]|tara:strand:+ start:6300 stop:6707 length:408 start_codon:yes stop_codon:yes gene_type:complete